jgi:Family of unknown function (DUF6082)
MIIAIVSTLISSVALVGVALSLLLQARQLRVNQLQATRAAQVELARFAAENREIISDIFADEPAEYLRGIFINWFVKYLELSYHMKISSRESVQLQVSRLFGAKYPSEWWVRVRNTYETEAATKKEREFFTIIDETHKRSAAPSTKSTQGPAAGDSEATQQTGNE